MRTPILILHICGGLAGLLSGAVAMSFRKGSRAHARAGRAFVISMLTMAAAGVFLAVLRFEPGNILGGMFTLYLVSTAWITAQRREQATKFSAFDWTALLVVLGVVSTEITFGIEAATSPTHLKYDYPAGPYFFIGSVALLALLGDIRVFLRRGISGTQRIARHLWRMCFALFIASSSLFLARQRLFPVIMRKTGTLVLLSFLPLILMVFWLLRARFAKSFGEKFRTPLRARPGRVSITSEEAHAHIA